MAAASFNGRSTALFPGSADPQGRSTVGRSTERRDDLLRPSYAGLQQRLVRSASCSTAQLFCAQGLLSQPPPGLSRIGVAITNLSQPRLRTTKNRPLRSGEDVSWGLTFYRIGETGFEPAASCSQSKRATKLRHSPTHPEISGQRAAVQPG